MFNRIALLATALLLVPFVVSGWGAGLSGLISDLLEEFEDNFLETMLVGHLEEGESESWDIGLDRDEYIAIALCDYDCDDIDICVNDECDSDTSDVAAVYVERTSILDISVEMYECDEAYCYYAVVIFSE